MTDITVKFTTNDYEFLQFNNDFLILPIVASVVSPEKFEPAEHHPKSGNLPDNCHPNIRTAIDYWRSIHLAHHLPGRQHLDPRDISKLLANVSLVDVVHDPIRFRLRLLGTGVVNFRGCDFTGQWLDECYTNFLEAACHHDFLELLHIRQPVWRRRPPSLTHNKDYHDVERIYLPFARDGRQIDMIFILFVFYNIS